MRKSIILILICLFGCNSSSPNEGERTSENANPQLGANFINIAPSVIAVPRPNSGQYSTEQARALLPQYLQRSIPVQKMDKVVTQWKSPTQGIRIHITADDNVEIIDYLGQNLTGAESINTALDSTMTFGNERSVLLTSETTGWESATKKTVIEILFQPSVQIYLIGKNEG